MHPELQSGFPNTTFCYPETGTEKTNWCKGIEDVLIKLDLLIIKNESI